jgi:aryl-alcohol dehydrogenase-like predicted oxidoreductase
MIMQTNKFGKTGQLVSRVGFGAWAIGAAWGEVNDDQAIAALHTALDNGMTFIDTADVYGNGHSEQLIAKVVKERGGARPYIATKLGRKLQQQTVAGYSQENVENYLNESLRNLETDTIDLVQLHCPSTDLYYHPEVFDRMDKLVQAGKIKNYGVSVERIEEAIKAIEYPNVVSVQIIFNAFRQRPAELFFKLAKEKNIAVIARVPLASGLLTGKFNAHTQFEQNDHRLFNRNGEAFDVGETFSGVPYEVGLQAVELVRPLVSNDATMAQMALRWILMFDAVTVVIPGARNPQQAKANAQSASIPALSSGVMGEIQRIYDEIIRPHVHQKW